MNPKKNLIVLKDKTVHELFMSDLPLDETIIVSKEETIQEIIPKLINTLETYSDSLIIEEDGIPIGFVGGFEILSHIYANPTFEGTKITVECIINKRLTTVSPETSLEELIKKYHVNQRAFGVILGNNNEDYWILSAKNALNAGSKMSLDYVLDDLQKKSVIEYSQEEKIGDIIQKMFYNKVRRLNLCDTQRFISDRAIIKYVQELNYLKNTDNFLELNSEKIRTSVVELVPHLTKITSICKIMHNSTFPCMMTENNIITPWDILNFLLTVEKQTLE
jgi:predicted transcriptional regulator